MKKKLFLIVLILINNSLLSMDNEQEKQNLKNQRKVLMVLKYGLQAVPWILSGILLLKIKKQADQIQTQKNQIGFLEDNLLSKVKNLTHRVNKLSGEQT